MGRDVTKIEVSDLCVRASKNRLIPRVDGSPDSRGTISEGSTFWRLLCLPRNEFVH